MTDAWDPSWGDWLNPADCIGPTCYTFPTTTQGKGSVMVKREPRLIQVDSRRRISLGWTNMTSDLYAATTEPDGTIILTPVTISPISAEAQGEQENPQP